VLAVGSRYHSPSIGGTLGIHGVESKITGYGRARKGGMRGASNVRRSRTTWRGRGRRRSVLLSGALLAAVALAAAWFTGGPWEGVREAFGSPEALRGYVLGFGVWAPVVFFVAQAA